MVLQQKRPSQRTRLDVFISESIAFHTAQESNARVGIGPQFLFPLDTAGVEARLLKAASGQQEPRKRRAQHRRRPGLVIKGVIPFLIEPGAPKGQVDGPVVNSPAC